MPRTFDLEAEFPTSVEQIHSTFGDEGYWRARLAANDAGSATLDSLELDTAGATHVVTTVRLLSERVPKLFAQLYVGELELVHRETWEPIDDGKVRGQIRYTLPGTPLNAIGAALLIPVGTGARLNCAATVTAKVPLIGGRIESFVGTRFAEGIALTQTFTTEWINEHGDLPD